jgi:hypothetical protein
MGRIKLLVTVMAACTALIGMAPAPASAHNGTSLTTLPQHTGWAEVIDSVPTASYPVFIWQATGWKAATFKAGTQVYVYPWGSGWVWVRYPGDGWAWRAMQAKYLQV